MAIRRTGPDGSSAPPRTTDAADAQRTTEARKSSETGDVPELDALVAEKGSATAATFEPGRSPSSVSTGPVDRLRLQPGETTRHGALVIADQARRDVDVVTTTARAQIAAQQLELGLLGPRVSAASTSAGEAFQGAVDHGALADSCLADARYDEGMSHLDEMGMSLEKSADQLEPADAGLAGEVRAQAAETRETRSQFDNGLTRALYEMVAKSTLESLGPGDRIRLGGGLAAGEGVKVGAEGSIEIAAFSKPDGKLGYKVTAEGSVLVKGDLKRGSGIEGQAAIGVAVELEAQSPAEAAELAARLTAATTPAGFAAQLVERGLTGDAGGLGDKVKAVTLKAALSAEEEADLGNLGKQKASAQLEKSITLHFENGRAVAAESGLLVAGGGQAGLGTALTKKQVGTPKTTAGGAQAAIELKQKVPLTGEYDLERGLRDGFDLLAGFPIAKSRDIELHASTDVRGAGVGVRSDIAAHGPSDQIDLSAMVERIVGGEPPEMPAGWEGAVTSTPYQYAEVGGKVDVEVVELELKLERTDVDDKRIVSSAL